MVINRLSELFNYNQVVQPGTVYIFQHTEYNNTEYATGTRSAIHKSLWLSIGLPKSCILHSYGLVLLHYLESHLDIDMPQLFSQFLLFKICCFTLYLVRPASIDLDCPFANFLFLLV